MSDDNEWVYDAFDRADEVLEGLSKDGYPPDAQWTILCTAISELIAKNARDEEDLRQNINITLANITGGSNLAFERINGGEDN